MRDPASAAPSMAGVEPPDGWRSSSQLWQLPLFGFGVAALLAVVQIHEPGRAGWLGPWISRFRALVQRIGAESVALGRQSLSRLHRVAGAEVPEPDQRSAAAVIAGPETNWLSIDLPPPGRREPADSAPSGAAAARAPLAPAAPPPVPGGGLFPQAERLIEQHRFHQAIDVLQAASTTPGIPPDQFCRAQRRLGDCWHELGDAERAVQAWQQASAASPTSDDGRVAFLQQAAALLAAGRDAQAWAVYRAWAGAGEPPREERIARFEQVWQEYCDRGQYDLAMDFAHALADVWGESLAHDHEAIAAQTEAQLCKQRALAAAYPESVTAAAAARALFSRAGRLYDALAETDPAPLRRIDRLWQSAGCWSETDDTARTLAAGAGFLATAGADADSRRNMVRVWQAQALQRRGRAAQAAAEFAACLQADPRGPVGVHARWGLAAERIRRGAWAAALPLLRTNVDLPRETAPEPWRWSLFALGEALYRLDRYDEARGRLIEAVDLYPVAAQAVPTRYYLADCTRRSSGMVGGDPTDLDGGDEPEANPDLHAELLVQALGEFRELRDQLARAAARGRLDPQHQPWRRRCQAAIGDCLFGLRRYDAAAAAYVAALHDQSNDSLALEMYLKLAACYRRSGCFDLARKALAWAELVLDELEKGRPARDWRTILDQERHRLAP